jgi:cytochrome c oxidase subunit 3
MTEHAVPEPYAAFPRQRHAASLGMWIFLASEVIFFGGLFLGYTTYRFLFPEAFATAGAETDILLGSINTALLLTSSATMAVAVWAGSEGMKPTVLRGLALTALLGLGFLGVKAYEYSKDFQEDLIPGTLAFPLDPPQTQIFFSFYWVMTALHAVHLTIGILAVLTYYVRVRGERFAWSRSGDLHALGLYWHLIDLIWIFLYPLLYLGGR